MPGDRSCLWPSPRSSYRHLPGTCSNPIPEQSDPWQEWLGCHGTKNFVVDAKHHTYSQMGTLHVLHVALHSSLKGQHCRGRGFATAAKVHGREHIFWASLSQQRCIPPSAKAQLSALCKPRTAWRSTFPLIAHPKPFACKLTQLRRC